MRRDLFFSGGEIGIRTLEALSALTHFPGVRLRPLGHLSLIGAAKVQKNPHAAHNPTKKIF